MKQMPTYFVIKYCPIPDIVKRNPLSQLLSTSELPTWTTVISWWGKLSWDLFCGIPNYSPLQKTYSIQLSLAILVCPQLGQSRPLHCFCTSQTDHNCLNPLYYPLCVYGMRGTGRNNQVIMSLDSLRCKLSLPCVPYTTRIYLKSLWHLLDAKCPMILIEQSLTHF